MLQAPIFSVVLLTCLVSYVVEAGHNTPWENEEGGRFSHEHFDWMKRIPDNVPLNLLAIPGTHETVSFHGGSLTKCQAVDLYSQFLAGIRAIDIRLRHIENVFAIHHGRVYQKKMFGDILNICSEFLKKYPSETIVVFVQEEHKPAKNTRSFKETFDDYRKRYGNLIWTRTTTPTIGEVRGKVVIIDTYGSVSGMGISRSKKMDWQNDWVVRSTLPVDINKKWRKVRDHLEKPKSDSMWYSNWLSGSSIGAHPFSVARAINDRAGKWIRDNRDDKVRIIMSDFPGRDLMHEIIMQNRKYVDNKVCYYH